MIPYIIYIWSDFTFMHYEMQAEFAHPCSFVVHTKWTQTIPRSTAKRGQLIVTHNAPYSDGLPCKFKAMQRAGATVNYLVQVC